MCRWINSSHMEKRCLSFKSRISVQNATGSVTVEVSVWVRCQAKRCSSSQHTGGMSHSVHSLPKADPFCPKVSSEEQLSYSFIISHFSIQVYLKGSKLAVLVEANCLPSKVEKENTQTLLKTPRSASWGKTQVKNNFQLLCSQHSSSNFSL